jgi:hypothetical protein
MLGSSISSAAIADEVRTGGDPSTLPSFASSGSPGQTQLCLRAPAQRSQRWPAPPPPCPLPARRTR